MRPRSRLSSVLTLEEARAAYRVGLRRHAAARARGGQHRHGWTDANSTPGERRDTDGQSAVAEALVAKALGRPWLSTGDTPDAPEDGDVGGGVSVRWTPRLNGCLIVHEDEPPQLVCVLVVGRAPGQRIAGWIHCQEAQASAYWRTNVRHPAHFVPQSALRPISEL